MKILLTFLALCLSARAAERLLVFDYDPAELGQSNLAWVVRSHTNINAPLSNWFVTIVPATSTTIRVTMNPERRYWTLQASNEWGLSDFSNTAGTAKPATNTVNLRIQ